MAERQVQSDMAETVQNKYHQMMVCDSSVLTWNPTLAWLICFPAVCNSPLSVVWSPNGSKVGERNRIVVMGWRGAWQAAGVGGVRRLAGWC